MRVMRSGETGMRTARAEADLGHWPCDLALWVSGLGFRVCCLGFRVQGAEGMFSSYSR